MLKTKSNVLRATDPDALCALFYSAASSARNVFCGLSSFWIKSATAQKNRCKGGSLLYMWPILMN